MNVERSIKPIKWVSYYLNRIKKPVMSQERMELLSNDRLTEFTIKLNSVTVVTTSNNPDTMTKIDECPYRSGYEFDWHYTLSQWVVYFWQTNLLFWWTPKAL
jgi:hypothetical protein